jgi:hypothetical protein
VLFNTSALRYAISKSCFHAVAAVQSATEPSVTSSAAASSSAAAPSPVFPQDLVDVGPQLWLILLLSLPLLHARALVGELADAASEYVCAINLLGTSPQAFKQRFNEAVSALFPQQQPIEPSGVGAGITALDHFRRFFRAYYDQISKKPEQVVQYALTFPGGSSYSFFFTRSLPATFAFCFCITYIIFCT